MGVIEFCYTDANLALWVEPVMTPTQAHKFFDENRDSIEAEIETAAEAIINKHLLAAGFTLAGTCTARCQGNCVGSGGPHTQETTCEKWQCAGGKYHYPED